MQMFELESESLLTQEQLVNSFERVHPACSLLFDTGAGYFAFSVTTNDSMQGKIVSPINAQNAMGQIRKYLDGEMRKKQILIVDDSDFMRSNMIRLLGNDYEMLESNSRQTLEMIRSDEEIADIPVVFLTGRGDAESVKKVMSLKPKGYLLKSMPEEDIKKYIDGILAKK